MEDLIIFLIYMVWIFGFLGLAGLLYELSERVPALRRLVDRILAYVDITGDDDCYDDYEDEDWEDDDYDD